MNFQTTAITFLFLTACFPEPENATSDTDTSSADLSSTSILPTSATSNTDSTGISAPFCGDGTVNDNEECDDGNNINEDACLINCKTAECGDNIIFEGKEFCDEGGNDTKACNANCTFAICGDGYINLEAGEECDNQIGCASDCKWEGTLVFVSSILFDPTIGTLNADIECQKLASIAKLEGSFRAWLWTSIGGPGVTWPLLPSPYTLLNGKLIATTWDQFYLGTWDNPINITEHGILYGDEETEGEFSNAAWVGYHADGIQSWPQDENCVDWTEHLALGGVQDLDGLNWNGLNGAWGISCLRNTEHFICVRMPFGQEF